MSEEEVGLTSPARLMSKEEAGQTYLASPVSVAEAGLTCLASPGSGAEAGLTCPCAPGCVGSFSDDTIRTCIPCTNTQIGSRYIYLSAPLYPGFSNFIWCFHKHHLPKYKSIRCKILAMNYFTHILISISLQLVR